MPDASSPTTSGFWTRDRGNGSPLALSLAVGIICALLLIVNTIVLSGRATFVPAALRGLTGGMTLGVAFGVILSPLLISYRAKRYYFLWGIVPVALAVVIDSSALLVLWSVQLHRSGSHLTIGFLAPYLRWVGYIILGGAALSGVVSIPKYIVARLRARRPIEVDPHSITHPGAWPPAPVTGKGPGEHDG